MKVIIIGGVAAGMSAAAKLKRLDKNAEVIVYEKTDIISFGACGLPYFVGDFFGDKNEMIARTAEDFRDTGINVQTFCEVIRVDTVTKKVTVRNIKTNEEFENNYDKLMIATGASAIVPPIKNIDLENVLTLKTMEDGIKLKALLQDEYNKRIVIVGAGFIGVEVVEAAKRLGKEVTLIQLQDRILPDVFDKEITDVLEEEIRRHCVDLRLNEKVTELKGNLKVSKVITDKNEIDADVVIIATGVRPNTEFLKDTGLEMMTNGAIIVDGYGKTSIEHIYAAGDCASIPNIVTGSDSFIPLATGANKLGRIVGENLAGNNVIFQGSLASSCLKVMDMEAGRTGLSEKEAQNLGINYKSVFITDMNQTSYYPGRNKIYVKLIYNAENKILLGGQIAGFKDSVQRVNVLAACIFGKMTTDQLGMLDLCYAPPFSRTWDVLNVSGNVCK